MDALDTSSAFLTSSTNGEELKNSLMPNQYFYPYDNEDLKQSNKNADKNNPPSHLRDALVKEEGTCKNGLFLAFLINFCPLKM